jgi:hypothetical protein
MNASRELVTYLFIDGGYIRRCYSEAVQPWFGTGGEIEFAFIRTHFQNAYKMFYYDCLDDIKRASETAEDFNERIEQQEKYFDKIPAIIRLGSLTGTAKNKRQKKVDVLLAVDMMKHAVRQNMNRAVLLAGDRDFEPVVETLIDLGIYVIVAGDERSISRHLIRAADEFRPIKFYDYYKWSVSSLREAYPLPQARGNISPPRTEALRSGLLGSDPCTLHSEEDEIIIFCPSYQDSHSMTITFNDLDRIKLYCQVVFGIELQI